MSVIDDTPESLPPTPKKRNTRSWKTIAKREQEALAHADTRNAGLTLRLAQETALAEAWQTTNTLNYRLFKAAAGVAIAGWLVVLWLVVGR